MRPGFTEQGPAKLARALVRDGRLLSERAWLVRTGHPPRAFEDYQPTLLEALLLFGDDTNAEITKLAASSDDRATRRPRWGIGIRKAPKDWDSPLLTGDPLADEWERAIARGEVPDLDAPMPRK